MKINYIIIIILISIPLNLFSQDRPKEKEKIEREAQAAIAKQKAEEEARRKELEALIGGSGRSSDFLLGNRELLSNPKPTYKCNKEGLVIVRIEVDIKGKVIKATPGVKGSTTTASCLLTEAKKAALRTKWQAKKNAPSIQIGTIKYRFSLSY